MSADQLVQAVAAQALPDVFKPGLARQYPGYISTIGYGSGYANAMADLEQRQYREARSYSYDADAERAANTIVGLFMTAAKVSGKTLTEEEQANIKEAARVHGRNIEVYLSMARAMGLSESAIDYIRRVFYGEKGSTLNLFDKTYNALRSRAGHGTAINFAKDLSRYQFGKKFDISFTGGLNADQYASTYAYMVQNGGFRGTDLSKGGGFALISDAAMAQTVNSMPAGSSVSDIVRAYEDVNFNNDSLMALNNRRALAMGTEVYKEELKKLDHGQLARELGTHLEANAIDALKRVDDLDYDINRMKGAYKVSLTKTRAGLLEAKAELSEQISEKLAEARKNNDKKAEKAILDYERRLIKDLEDLYTGTGEYDAKTGKELNSFELAAKTKANINEIASDKMKAANREYSKLKLSILALTKKKHELEDSEDPNKAEKISKIDKMIEFANVRKTAFENTSVIGKVVTNMHGPDSDAGKSNEDKVKAYGNVAMGIFNAMKAAGKPIQLEEALQASKAIMPMGESAQAMRTVQEAITQSLNGVTARHGSVEQYLLQLSSGKGIAEQYGATSVQATLLANMGTQFNKYGALYGLTDADSKKGADDLTREAAKNQHRGIVAATMMYYINKDRAGDNEIAKATSTLSDEDKARFNKLQQKLKTEGAASFSELESRDLESLMLRSGLVRSTDLQAKSVNAQRATEQEAETYQNAIMGATNEVVFREKGDKSSLNLKMGVSVEQAREIYKNFFVKDQEAIRQAVFKGGVGGKEALRTAIDKADIADEHKAKLKELIKNNGLHDFEDILTFSGLGDAKEASQQAAFLATTTNFEKDRNEDKVRAKVASIFDQTDPSSLGRITELISSKKFNAAGTTMKDKMNMLVEAWGTNLTKVQRQAAAFTLLRDGKLAEGMAYTGEDGKTAYLNKGDIDVATYAVQNPEEFSRKIAEAGHNGVVEIKGKHYTTQAAMRMKEHGEKAVGEALGLKDDDLQNATNDRYFNNLSEDTLAKYRIASTAALIGMRAFAVRKKQIDDPRLNFIADEYHKGGKYKELAYDIARKIESGEASMADYGIDEAGRQELREALKNVNERGRASKHPTSATSSTSVDIAPMVDAQNNAVNELKQVNTNIQALTKSLEAM